MLISNVARISGLPLVLLTLAIAGGAIAPLVASPATAQVPITTGVVVYENTRIFVPNLGSSKEFNTTEVFEGQQPTLLRIQTPQGPIPNNAVFRPSADPRLLTEPGAVPQLGDRGEHIGNLTFRGFTSNGSPALYSNIPTKLDFQVSAGRLGEPQDVTRYGLPPVSMKEAGTVTTETSVTTVERTSVITPTLYQPGDLPPTDQQINGQIVPAATYQFQASGLAYRADFEAALLNTGTIDIPNSPGFNATGSPNPNAPGGGIETFEPPVLSVPVFTPPANNPPSLGEDPSLQFLLDSLLSSDLNLLLFGFPSLPSNVLFDLSPFSIISDSFLSSQPSDTFQISSKGDSKNQQKSLPAFESFTFTMKPGPQPLGMASRVFPGLLGQQQQTSLFTEIIASSKGVDAGNRFTVTVEGAVLGEFSADQTIDFQDFRAQLGDRLVKGQGVRTFVISGIKPSVNASNPRAFPMRLVFNTPTASFDMQAAGLSQ